ncbi:MAG: hypothetical protein K0Q87_4221, partial [Neobacillus sp.]|nr:hypothetical protein [Neobacillus sp.]
RELLGCENLKLTLSGTGQEWFDEWKVQVMNRRDATSMEFMQKNYPKTAILLQMLEHQKT